MKAKISYVLDIRLICILAALAFMQTGCANATPNSSENSPVGLQIFSDPLILPTSTYEMDAFSTFPEEARTATQPGDPRPPAYWAVWNRCAEDNRAVWADANGGRAAGWTLMDDLLGYPGIKLGDYQVVSCEVGLNLVLGKMSTGEESDDPVYELASVLLAAELNLNVGSENCPIAEEAVIGGHLVLSSANFNGEGSYADKLSLETTSAIPRLVELLEGYNSGSLCR